jgi:hypothetical protein
VDLDLEEQGILLQQVHRKEIMEVLDLLMHRTMVLVAEVVLVVLVMMDQLVLEDLEQMEWLHLLLEVLKLILGEEELDLLEDLYLEGALEVEVILREEQEPLILEEAEVETL